MTMCKATVLILIQSTQLFKVRVYIRFYINRRTIFSFFLLLIVDAQSNIQIDQHLNDGMEKSGTDTAETSMPLQSADDSSSPNQSEIFFK